MSEATVNHADERIEKIVVGGAIALALVLTAGLVANKAGWLSSGEADWDHLLKPSLDVLASPQSGPKQIFLDGVVRQDDTRKSLEALLHKTFADARITNRITLNDKLDEKRAVAQIRFIDRFSDVKRLGFAWQGGKIVEIGAVYTGGLRGRLEEAFMKLPEAERSAFEVRESDRPAVDPVKLTADLASAVAGKVVEFEKGDAALAPAGKAVLDALLPMLANMQGLRLDVVMRVEGTTVADDDVANLQVSQQHAQAVVAYLQEKGLDPTHVRGRGIGETRKAEDPRIVLIVREME